MVMGIFVILEKNFGMPSKIYHVDLETDQRKMLEDIVARLKSTNAQVRRSKILLAADRNGDKVWGDGRISEQYEVGRRTVERIRQRFVEDGLETVLKGKPRLNLDKKLFDGEVEAKLVALRCSDPDQGNSRWTLRMLADKMVELEYVERISHESVRQLLKKTGSSPGGSRNG